MSPLSGQQFLIPTLNMTLLKLVKVKISVEIKPKYFSYPKKGINKSISSHLLKYSHKIEGMPVAFNIESFFGTGICEDTGGVITMVFVEYIVVHIAKDVTLISTNGMVLGVFCAKIDGDEEYNGSFTVERVVQDEVEKFEILGKRPENT